MKSNGGLKKIDLHGVATIVGTSSTKKRPFARVSRDERVGDVPGGAALNFSMLAAEPSCGESTMSNEKRERAAAMAARTTKKLINTRAHTNLQGLRGISQNETHSVWRSSFRGRIQPRTGSP